MFRKKEKLDLLEIRIYPINDSGEVCRADPWGYENFRHCPFLRNGYCRIWGHHTARRVDKTILCPLKAVQTVSFKTDDLPSR